MLCPPPYVHPPLPHAVSSSILLYWFLRKRLWATLPAAHCASSAGRLITSLYIVALLLNKIMALKWLGTTFVVRGCTYNRTKLNNWLKSGCFDHKSKTKAER